MIYIHVGSYSSSSSVSVSMYCSILILIIFNQSSPRPLQGIGWAWPCCCCWIIILLPILLGDCQWAGLLYCAKVLYHTEPLLNRLLANSPMPVSIFNVRRVVEDRFDLI